MDSQPPNLVDYNAMVGGAVDYTVVDLSIFDTSPERFALIPHVCRTKGNVIFIFLLGNNVMAGGLNRQ